MLKVEKFETFNWEGAIRGARNPMNSWDKSDSKFGRDPDYGRDGSCPCEDFGPCCTGCFVGPNDLDLLKRLRNGNSDDRKYLRQIFVCCDITAPLYWWKEMDQYKVATVTDSCSTMHKIASKPFEMNDFSHEHLLNAYSGMPAEAIPMYSAYGEGSWSPLGVLYLIVNMLNICRKKYLETKDKIYWWQMIQLLPSSYNQKRTWTGNYENLVGIYRARHNHKLDEWRTFCEAIEKLPYAKELIIGETKLYF